MRSGLSLSQKGLILVAAPLVFEVAFVLILNHMLQQAELEVEREAHARAIVKHLNNLHLCVMGSAGGMVAYMLSGNPVNLRHAVASGGPITTELTALEKLCAEKPDETQAVKQIRAMTVETNEIVNHIYGLTKDNGGRPDINQMNLLKKHISRLRQQTDKIIVIENQIEEASPKLQAGVRSRVRQFLIGGVIFNVLLAISLAIYFNRGTSKRLSTLMDNTYRLASGKALNPPLQGSDEIAHLDDTFQRMAEILAEAKRKDKEVEEMKRELVSIVSHELRTPLTSIQGFLTLLAEEVYGQLNEQGQKRISLADRSVEHLIRLVNDLLAVEKLESGNVELNLTAVRFEAVFERALEGVSQMMARRNVRVDADYDKEILISADEDRLTQVVTNLLSNAIKYSPDGGLITLQARKSNVRLDVRITDQGSGVPAAAQRRIFERFQQVNAVEDERKGGTGLGLAICKAIIEQHGGAIGVESELGKGSTFWFNIPVRDGILLT